MADRRETARTLLAFGVAAVVALALFLLAAYAFQQSSIAESLFEFRPLLAGL